MSIFSTTGGTPQGYRADGSLCQCACHRDANCKHIAACCGFAPQTMTNEHDSVAVLYADRDHEQLGEHYARHVAAMTAEGLHAKSDIAAELAWRDAEIDRLTREAAPQASGGDDDDLVFAVTLEKQADLAKIKGDDYGQYFLREAAQRIRRLATTDSAPDIPDDDELPGMWERADLIGGETDSAPAIQSQQGATGGADALLREVLDECACGPCVGSMAPFEDLCGRIERYTKDGRTVAGTSSGLSEGDAKLICALHNSATPAVSVGDAK